MTPKNKLRITLIVFLVIALISLWTLSPRPREPVPTGIKSAETLPVPYPLPIQSIPSPRQPAAVRDLAPESLKKESLSRRLDHQEIRYQARQRSEKIMLGWVRQSRVISWYALDGNGKKTSDLREAAVLIQTLERRSNYPLVTVEFAKREGVFSPKTAYVSDQLLVKTRDRLNPKELQAILDRSQAKIRKPVDGSPDTYLVEFPFQSVSQMDSLIRTLKQDLRIVYVGKDYFAFVN